MSKKQQTLLTAGRTSAQNPSKSWKELHDLPETVGLTIDVTKEQRIKLKIGHCPKRAKLCCLY
jgi:hypothetical protein